MRVTHPAPRMRGANTSTTHHARVPGAWWPQPETGQTKQAQAFGDRDSRVPACRKGSMTRERRPGHAPLFSCPGTVMIFDPGTVTKFDTVR